MTKIKNEGDSKIQNLLTELTTARNEREQLKRIRFQLQQNNEVLKGNS